MSQLFVDNIKNRTGGAIGAPSGVVVTGVVTATSFVGSGVALTGIDATALKDSGGSVKVQANTSGIVVTGVSTFSGNVSVGGTLTYEDVTNIDSIGIITARSGINVSKKVAGYDSLQAGYFDIVSGPTPDPIVYNVIYASKDSTHRYFGQGSGLGYKIDGVFSPWLTLTPGRKYRFLMSSSDMSAHPFRFYLEADKATAYTTNVTSTSTYTEILVTDSTPQVLHYQCSLHGYMGNGANTNSNIASSAFTGTVSDSIGPLRRLGVNAQGGAYAFVVGDAGKIIRSAGSGSALTLNQNIFTAGDMISVFNVGSGTNTVVQGTGVTLYNTADAATGTRTIAAKGMVTIVCTASNEFAISGSQLT